VEANVRENQTDVENMFKQKAWFENKSLSTKRVCLMNHRTRIKCETISLPNVFVPQTPSILAVCCETELVVENQTIFCSFESCLPISSLLVFAQEQNAVFFVTDNNHANI